MAPYMKSKQDRDENMYTLTIRQKSKDIDIRVLPNQRIHAVLQVLKENGHISGEVDNIYVYSKRRQEYLNQMMTFRQAGIYSGDTLELQ